MKIVVLEGLAVPEEKLREIAKPITDQGHELVLFEKTDDLDLQKAHVKDCEILVIGNMPLAGEVIRAAEKLRYIAVAFTGYDHVDLEACKEKNIQVSNAAGYATVAVPELTFGLILALLRNIVATDSATRKGQTKAGYRQQEIYGKTFGVLGTGAIGARVARIALAFEARVIAHDLYEKDDLKALGVEYVPLDELLAQSDIVTIHSPLLPSTKGLISKEKLALMKPTAILVNAARGPIVDIQALTDSLQAGTTFGAAFDVFDTEPPLAPDYPFLSAPRTVVTPHIGFATEEAMVRRAHITFDENIANWLKGDLKNPVLK